MITWDIRRIGAPSLLAAVYTALIHAYYRSRSYVFMLDFPIFRFVTVELSYNYQLDATPSTIALLSETGSIIEAVLY